MVRFAIRALAAVTVLVVYLPFQASPGEGAMTEPFQMRIVDSSGNGIPHVRVTSETASSVIPAPMDRFTGLSVR